jgi:hypothetical protein
MAGLSGGLFLNSAEILGEIVYAKYQDIDTVLKEMVSKNHKTLLPINLFDHGIGYLFQVKYILPFKKRIELTARLDGGKRNGYILKVPVNGPIDKEDQSLSRFSLSIAYRPVMTYTMYFGFDTKKTVFAGWAMGF